MQSLLIRQFAWNVKAYFLGKMKKYFKKSAAEIFTQHAEFQLPGGGELNVMLMRFMIPPDCGEFKTDCCCCCCFCCCSSCFCRIFSCLSFRLMPRCSQTTSSILGLIDCIIFGLTTCSMILFTPLFSIPDLLAKKIRWMATLLCENILWLKVSFPKGDQPIRKIIWFTGCSKLTVSIIKTLIIKYGIYTNIFAEKIWVAFAFAKATHIFSAKNSCELDNVLTRIVNILTTNELVKLMMLWTTGPGYMSPFLVEVL